jgi:hypothetical protein
LSVEDQPSRRKELNFLQRPGKLLWSFDCLGLEDKDDAQAAEPQ